MSEQTQNTNGTQTPTEQMPTTEVQPQTANKLGIAMVIMWGVFSVFMTVLIIILIISAIKYLRKRSNG